MKTLTERAQAIITAMLGAPVIIFLFAYFLLSLPLLTLLAGGLAMILAAIFAAGTKSVSDTVLWFTIGSLSFLLLCL